MVVSVLVEGRLHRQKKGWVAWLRLPVDSQQSQLAAPSTLHLYALRKDNVCAAQEGAEQKQMTQVKCAESCSCLPVALHHWHS